MNDYKSPYYADLTAKVEEKLRLPPGLLHSIVTRGERSNADQVSEAGAKTVFQVIPETRDAILKKYGIDAYLSPENAAEAAGLLLRESLQRNGGDVAAAVGEYHGGTNRRNWGPRTQAYIGRVTNGLAADNSLIEEAKAWKASKPLDDAEIEAAKQWKAGRSKPVPILPAIEGQPYTPTPTPEPTIGDRLAGAGEAALTLGSAALTGIPGAAVGFIAGAGEELASGEFGSPEAARRIQDRAAQGSQAYVYRPRTEQGISNVQDVSSTLAPLQALGPMVGELSAVANMARPANVIAGANLAAREVLDTAKTAIPSGLRKAPTAQPAATVAPAVAQLSADQIAATARKAAEPGIGRARAETILAEQASPDPAIVKSAERLGIKDYLQPDHVTTSEAYRQVVGAIKSNNTSKLAIAEREGLAEISRRAAALVEEIGGKTDMSEVSASVRGRMQTIIQELDDVAETKYGQLRSAIPQKSEAPAPSVLAFVNQRADELGGVSNLSAAERSILSKLSPKDGKQPSYALLDDVRRDFTAAKYRRQGPFKDADTGLIKKLEMELLKDQKAAAERFGVLDVFDEARKAVGMRKGVEDDMVALFGRNLDKSIAWRGQSGIGGAVSASGKGDAASIGRLVAAVPAEMRQEVVASGLGSIFRNAARQGELDPTAYVRFYSGLKQNRQAYTAVMTNLPLTARKQLEALYRVSLGMSKAREAKVMTGRLGTVKAELMGTDGLMESLYTYAKRASAGVAAEAVTTPLGMPGAGFAGALGSALARGKPKSFQAVDDLIASPEFAALAAAKSKPQQKTAAIRLARTKEFARFAASIGNPKEVRNREAWIAAAMQQSQQPQTPRDKLTLH